MLYRVSYLKCQGQTLSISATSNKDLLQLSFKVHTVSFRPSFFPLDGLSTKCVGHTVTYGTDPETRVMRRLLHPCVQIEGLDFTSNKL